MNIALFIIVLFILQAFCFYVARKSSEELKDQKDYFIAGKNVRLFPLIMTFVATQVGGGLVLGASEEAYQFGWSVLLYPLGNSLGFMALALGVGKRMAEFKVSTVAQIFEVAFRSVTLKKIASLLSMISLFMILIGQIIASKKFMLSLGVESTFIFVGFWSIVIAYTVLGGLKAVIATDVVQALFFIVIFSISFFAALGTSHFSFGQIVDIGASSEHFDLNSGKLTGWLLMPFLFMVIEQDMGQRCFAAKTPKVVSKAAFYAAIVSMTICLIPVFFGVLGKASGLTLGKGSSVLMDVITATTSPAVAAFVGCAILAAVISTADSLINAISSNLTQDFHPTFFEKGNKLLISKWMTAMIAIVALLLSFRFNNVVDMLIQSYELSVSCLFVPVFIALFKREGSTLSAALAVAFGAISYCLFKFVPMEFPREIASVLISGAGYGLGELSRLVVNKKGRDLIS